jgi:hypothetical protein
MIKLHRAETIMFSSSRIKAGVSSFSGRGYHGS